MRAAAAVSSPEPPCDPLPPPRTVPADHPFAAFADRLSTRIERLRTESESRSVRRKLSEWEGRELSPDDVDAMMEDDADLHSELVEYISDDLARDLREEMPELAPGLEFLGSGDRRVALAISPTEVLKVLIDPQEDVQHERELALWRSAPEGLARFLCPLLAHGPSWSVMARCEALDEIDDLADFAAFWPQVEAALKSVPERRLARALSGDLSVKNSGRWCGRLVVVDYGGAEW